MDKTPYLHVVAEPRMMKGKGAPRSTVFGVLGRTKETGENRVLGGLVREAPSGKILAGTLDKHPRAVHTERNITGPASKTHISGMHYGQVPYAGRYMGHAGAEL
jgi:hypothetical protein